jgi:hypothetical protein
VPTKSFIWVGFLAISLVKSMSSPKLINILVISHKDTAKFNFPESDGPKYRGKNMVSSKERPHVAICDTIRTPMFLIMVLLFSLVMQLPDLSIQLDLE